MANVDGVPAGEPTGGGTCVIASLPTSLHQLYFLSRMLKTPTRRVSPSVIRAKAVASRMVKASGRKHSGVQSPVVRDASLRPACVSDDLAAEASSALAITDPGDELERIDRFERRADAVGVDDVALCPG